MLIILPFSLGRQMGFGIYHKIRGKGHWEYSDEQVYSMLALAKEQGYESEDIDELDLGELDHLVNYDKS